MRNTLKIALFLFAAFSIIEAPAISQTKAIVPGRPESHEERLSRPQNIPWKRPFGIRIPRHSAGLVAFPPVKVNQDSTTEPQNECSVAINPKNRNNFVCVFRDFYLGGGENNTIPIRNVGIATTTDGGATWSETHATYGNHNRFSDPDVAVDTAGNFYVVALSSSTTGAFNSDASVFSVRVSTDGGLSWGIPIITDPQAFHDKEMITVDTMMNSASINNVYVPGWIPSGHANMTSTNGAQSFNAPVPINGYYITPAVGISGELYCVNDGAGIQITKSTDGGTTFGVDTTISGSYPPADVSIDGNISSIGEPVVAVDRSQSVRRGAVYVTWQSNPFGDGDIFCKSSSDQGHTWSDPVRVNNDTVGNGRDQFHHWMTVDDSGYIDCVFLDRRNDPSNLLCDAYFAQSRDGGKSFKNFRLTPQNFDPRLYPGPDARFGDYMGIAASQGRIVPIWVDTRSGNEDIYVSVIDQSMLGRIEGTVFNDCNGDGVQEPDEAFVGGVRVLLSHDGGVDTAVTDANGRYTFDGLFASTYGLSLQSTQQSFPQHGGYTVALGRAQTASGKNFGVSLIQQYAVTAGWNLISIPQKPQSRTVGALFHPAVT